MESYIFIDGPVMWVVLMLIAFVLFGFFYFACKCLDTEMAIDRLKAHNTKLREKLSETQDKLYKATYKPPEVTDDAGMS